ncbi:MAG: hypothetical protein AAGC76_11355 [Luteibacter sp.]|uniref:hypothetical protein n=1 Tax=Luteibacter sp. TaxID=1886636 RepID=UPI002809755F|nr:hypothetical protein [Luteibacter sp.]MDQ7996438.1 hypothetical protein [Luteibacter sp.]MDQ8047934.1 hypothetical protein [Luteibacter sp.]
MTPTSSSPAGLPQRIVDSGIKGIWASRIAVALAFLSVVLALLGIARNYSAVPFGDMWDGYVSFFLRARDGGAAPWIEPHGEHRIILSRPFFYADVLWFGGRGVLPLIIGPVLAGGVAGIFCLVAANLGMSGPRSSRVATYSVIVAACFFWSQRENFTWAFQIQFFLAQLLPLAAFYLTARARDRRHPLRNAGVWAVVIGVLAMGGMANGILTLPLVLILGAAIGLRRRWVLVTGGVTLLALLVFTLGFQGSQTHTPMLSVLLERPLDVFHFVLRYLGAPFWFIVGGAPWAIWLAEAAGAAAILVGIVTAPRIWTHRYVQPLGAAMITMFGFVVATAAIAALGRLPLPGGLAGAITSRYTGMAIIAWLSLLLSNLPGVTSRSHLSIPFAAVALLLALMPCQLRAPRDQSSMRYRRDLAALALAAQAPDPDAVSAIFPADRTSYVLHIASIALHEHLPVFGDSALGPSIAMLGTQAPPGLCSLGIEGALPLAGADEVRRVDGHLPEPTIEREHSRALLVDDRDTIVGWVQVRPGRARKRADTAPGAAFSGYVRDPRTRDPQWLITTLRICQPRPDALLAHSE